MRFRDLVTGESTYAMAVADAARDLAVQGWTWSGTFGAMEPGPGRASREAAILAYGPVGRRNGFQGALYSRAWDSGIAPLPVCAYDDFARLPWPGALICHFHWLAPVTHDCATAEAADAAVEGFAALLDELKRQQRSIVWTVHDVVSPDAAWPEHDLKVHRLMATAADIVHAMTPHGGEAALQRYPLAADKLLVVAHPCYLGMYPDHQSRSEARFELALAADELVFLNLADGSGQNDYDQLMSAWDRLRQASQSPSLKLIIAGDAFDAPLRSRLAAWALGRSDVRVLPGAISAEELQTYFRAADLAICPQTLTLNPGAAMLSLTFAVPVIAPSTGTFAEVLGGGAGILYAPDDPDGLYRALEESLSRDLGALRESAAASIRQLTPAAVSDSFCLEIKRRLNLGAAEAA